MDAMKTKIYRYGCPMRPPAPGAIPKGAVSMRMFDAPDEECRNCRWGWVEYDHPLSSKELGDYELIHLVTYER